MTGPAPLRNAAALVLASAAKAGEICRGLERLGCRAVFFPTIELRQMPAGEHFRRAVSDLGSYDWILFTSAYGVETFCRLLRSVAGETAGARPWPQVCAVGPATARRLSQEGIATDLIPAVYSAEGALEALAARAGGARNLAGMRFLFPCAREARDLIPSELTRVGAVVEVLPVYENLPASPGADAILRVTASPPQLIVCTSPSAAAAFVGILGEAKGRELLAGAVLAAIGPVTAEALRSLCREPEIVPAQHTIAALLAAIEDYHRRRTDRLAPPE